MSFDMQEPRPSSGRNVDHWISLAAMMSISITSVLVYLGLPVITGALAEGRGFDEAQIGLFASISTGTSFIAALIANRIVGHFPRRRILLVGLALLALGHAGYIPLGFGFDILLLFSIISGLGGGLCYATSMGILAGASNPVRVFSVLIFFQVVTSALELAGLPHVVAAWGVSGLFALITAITVAVALLVPLVPERQTSTEKKAAELPPLRGRTSFAGAFALSGVFFFYIAIGSIWTFAERMGVSLKLEPDFVGSALSAGNLISLVGSLTAVAFAARVGLSKALICSLLALAASLAFMGSYLTVATYVGGIAAFFLCWSFVDIFQASTLSQLDKAGRFTALIPAAQTLGNTAGPAAAGFMLQGGFTYGSVLIFTAVCAFGGMLAHSVARLIQTPQPTPDQDHTAQEAL